METLLRRGLFILPALLVLLLVACSNGDDAPAATPTPEPTPAPLAVTMADNNFSPNSLTARAGLQVIVNLKNDGQRSHTFTIDGITDSGRLTTGTTGSVQFTASAGTLTFYCTVHGRDNMNGTLTVTAGAQAEPPAADAVALATH